MSEDWKAGDPFSDPDDPAAREREERRREREAKRQGRGEKKADRKAEKRAAKKAKEAAKAEAAPPPPEKPAEPPKPPRTPEEEFWDEDPPTPEPETPKAEPEVPAPVVAAVVPDPPEPVTPEPAREQSWESDSPDTPDPPAEDWGDEWHDDGDPELAGAGSRGGRGGGEKRGFFGSLLHHPFRVLGVILAIVAVWFLYSLFQPFHGDGNGKVAVTIPKGSSVSEVGDLLGKKGVIDSSTMFQIRVTLEGKRSDLFAGHFTLAHNMSYGAAIDALSTEPKKPTITTVTIPEGYSRPQAAELVEEDGVPGSYTKATVKSKYLNPAQYGGKKAKNLEGFLFPDTFELKPKAPVADLVQLQLQDFKKKIKGVDMKYAKSKNLTVYDVLTIASMIEREAGVAKQRKLVSSVIYNRLHEGMPLGIDATIRFAVNNYSAPLTESQLEVDSPYNSRTNVGLPPGPINSPGLAAIEAAAHPAKTGYIFYVNKPNTCGELAFAKTEAEFEANVAAYEKAREENGGNEPTSCGE